MNATYEAVIEGERTTDESRDTMISYLKLKAKEGDENNPSLESQLGSADVLFALACVESYGVSHFYPTAVNGDGIPNGSLYGVPLGSNYPIENESGDGGLGMMQLTEPIPSYEQIWHWKRNVDAGAEVLDDKINDTHSGAIGYPERRRKKLPDVDDFTTDQLRMDAYSLYRGGHYWQPKYNASEKNYQWIPRYDKNSDDEDEKKDYRDSGVYEADEAIKHEGKDICQ